MDKPWISKGIITHEDSINVGEIPSPFFQPFSSCLLKAVSLAVSYFFRQFTVSTAAPQGSCCLYCGRDIITTSPPLMIVYHRRKAINTNIAMLANTLLSIDLIATLAGCGLLCWRRTSHYQRSWHAVPHCAVGLFLISTGPALQRHRSPRSMTDCCNYSRRLSDGNWSPAGRKIILRVKREIWTCPLPYLVIHSHAFE